MEDRAYIERDALIQEIKTRRNQAQIGKTEAARWAKIIAAIPAADVRPVVRGEWIASKAMVGIAVNFDPIIGDTYRCSICHEDLTKKYRFCPNCGADMRGDA